MSTNSTLVRIIKILDIGYIAIIYIAIAFAFAYITDKIMGDFDEKKESKKSSIRLTLEMVIGVWMYGVLTYIVRNVVELIPSPLNGLYGFKHIKVKELTSAEFFMFTYFIVSNYLITKILFYYNHILLPII
jgi:hypothetical protein